MFSNVNQTTQHFQNGRNKLLNLLNIGSKMTRTPVALNAPIFLIKLFNVITLNVSIIIIIMSCLPDVQHQRTFYFKGFIGILVNDYNNHFLKINKETHNQSETFFFSLSYSINLKGNISWGHD